MGVVNSKMGVTPKILRAPRAVIFMLTYSEISAGALDDDMHYSCQGNYVWSDIQQMCY